MRLHALLQNLPMRVFFQLPPQISMPYVKVGSTKALNIWDLSSQYVIPTTVYFLIVPIKVFILAILRLLIDGSKYLCV